MFSSDKDVPVPLGAAVVCLLIFVGVLAAMACELIPTWIGVTGGVLLAAILSWRVQALHRKLGIAWPEQNPDMNVWPPGQRVADVGLGLLLVGLAGLVAGLRPAITMGSVAFMVLTLLLGLGLLFAAWRDRPSLSLRLNALLIVITIVMGVVGLFWSGSE